MPAANLRDVRIVVGEIIDGARPRGRADIADVRNPCASDRVEVVASGDTTGVVLVLESLDGDISGQVVSLADVPQ